MNIRAALIIAAILTAISWAGCWVLGQEQSITEQNQGIMTGERRESANAMEPPSEEIQEGVRVISWIGTAVSIAIGLGCGFFLRQRGAPEPPPIA